MTRLELLRQQVSLGFFHAFGHLQESDLSRAIDAAYEQDCADARDRIMAGYKPWCPCGHGQDDICAGGAIYGPCSWPDCSGGCSYDGECKSLPDCCEARGYGNPPEGGTCELARRSVKFWPGTRLRGIISGPRSFSGTQGHH